MSWELKAFVVESFVSRGIRPLIPPLQTLDTEVNKQLIPLTFTVYLITDKTSLEV